MNSKNLVREGSLTLVGKTHDGKSVEIEAEVTDLEVSVEHFNDTLWSNRGYASSGFSTRTDTTFTLKVKDGWKVKSIPVRSGVKRTARVEALFIPENTVYRNLSISEIREAAEKAGVEEDTEFIIRTERDPARAGRVIYVEFRWSD